MDPFKRNGQQCAPSCAKKSTSRPSCWWRTIWKKKVWWSLDRPPLFFSSSSKVDMVSSKVASGWNRNCVITDFHSLVLGIALRRIAIASLSLKTSSMEASYPISPFSLDTRLIQESLQFFLILIQDHTNLSEILECRLWAPKSLSRFTHISLDLDRLDTWWIRCFWRWRAMMDWALSSSSTSFDWDSMIVWSHLLMAIALLTLEHI